MSNLKLNTGIHELVRAERIDLEWCREMVLSSDRVVRVRDTRIGLYSPGTASKWCTLGRLPVFVSAEQWAKAKRNAGWTVTEAE
jgi:hypothetical protein